MRSTQLDADGTVRCPVCQSTSFVSKSTTKGKVAGGLLFAPKRLRCNGCSTYLQPGKPPPPPSFKQVRADTRARMADLDERLDAGIPGRAEMGWREKRKANTAFLKAERKAAKI